MSRKNKEAEAEDRRRIVAANLVAGGNYRDIAEVAKCSIGTVARDVEIILGRWRREQISAMDDWITLQCRRLDASINFLWPKIKEGDPTAIGRMQAVMEQQGKFLGYERMFQVLSLNLNMNNLPDEIIDKLARGDYVDLNTLTRYGSSGQAPTQPAR